MTQKMKFAVEDIHLLEDTEIDKTQFSLLRVDAFATGKSLHDTFVTEETLKKTAKTILQKPFVFAVDKRFDDLGTHEPQEVAGGFVPHNSRLEFKTLPDGRLMLSCDVLIWKRYSGKLIEYFQRDGGKKGVSVEIEVYESREDKSSGLLEIVDFCYNAITGLGDMIQSAIPNAEAVMAFAKEFEEAKVDFETYAKYDEISFKIPQAVKSNASEGLELHKKHGRGGTSVGLSTARYILKNETCTPEKVRHIAKYFPRHADDNLDDKTSNGWIAWQLWGGDAGRKWSTSLVKKMNELDEKKMSYFAEEEAEMIDTNPEPKETEPQSELSEDTNQDNYLGIESFSLDSSQVIEIINICLSDFKYGENNWRKYWAESFDDTYAYIYDNEEDKRYRVPYTIENRTCVCDMNKKEIVIRGGYEVMAEVNDEKKFNYAEVFAKDEEFAKMFAEVEEDEEEGEEREEGEKEAYAQAKEEFGVGGNPAVVMSAMRYAMKRMAKRMAKAKEQSAVYMSENAEMKQKFAEQEQKEKSFAVDSFLKELGEKVVIPEDKFAEMKSKADEFTFSTINEWKNHCKAVSFDFALKEKAKEEDKTIITYGLPFEKLDTPQTGNVWDTLN